MVAVFEAEVWTRVGIYQGVWTVTHKQMSNLQGAGYRVAPKSMDDYLLGGKRRDS